VGGGLTLLDPLLGRPALVVEADDGAVRPRKRGDDEAHPGKGATAQERGLVRDLETGFLIFPDDYLQQLPEIIDNLRTSTTSRNLQVDRPTLRVQVTRPKMPEGFWRGDHRRLQRTARPDPGRSPHPLGRHRGEATRHARERRLGHQRDQEAVVDAFRQRYGEEARRIGFKAVWLVVWSGAITWRLDT
jgi:hypothetical protein